MLYLGHLVGCNPQCKPMCWPLTLHPHGFDLTEAPACAPAHRRRPAAASTVRQTTAGVQAMMPPVHCLIKLLGGVLQPRMGAARCPMLFGGPKQYGAVRGTDDCTGNEWKRSMRPNAEGHKSLSWQGVTGGGVPHTSRSVSVPLCSIPAGPPPTKSSTHAPVRQRRLAPSPGGGGAGPAHGAQAPLRAPPP